jgi:hypothetical protein
MARRELAPRFKPGQTLTAYAVTADIVPGRFVKPTAAINSNGDIPCTHATAGALALGVSQGLAVFAYAEHAQERRCPINTGGVVRMEAGAAVTALAVVASDATGRAITHTAGANALGIALNAATDAGDIILVAFLPAVSDGDLPATAFIADPVDPGALTIGAIAALTATDPTAIDAAGGEATAAALDDTQALEATVSALFADVTELHTELTAAGVDLGVVHAALVATNNKIDAVIDLLIARGLMAPS